MAERILVVDDTPVNLMLLRSRLTRQGFEVMEARDGSEALQAVRTQKVDLVLLDIMMPGISGLDVLRTLRETHSAAQLPVIMTTAMSESRDIVEALTLGANDYVTKPIDFQVALARIRTQLEVKRLTEDLEKRNRFIRKTFGRYLSDDVVASILQSEEGLRLGGESRVVTILMSDLRGFTSVCETLSPEQVVQLLNIYLGAMAEVISRWRGTIDEFIGDAVLAIFGAPFSGADDAERAAACALEMQLAMAEVNAKGLEQGLPAVEMGIGLNTGIVIVGSIGSEARAKYGVVGSNVNLTSRIEAATVGGQILMSTATRDAVGAGARLGITQNLRAKGFHEPIETCELLGLCGRHEISLPATRDELLSVRQPLAALFTILDGKDMGGVEFPAVLRRVSLRRAELSAQRSLPALTNVRLRLTTSDGVELGHVYGKVAEEATSDGFMVTFTAVPPQVRDYLAAAIV